MIDFAFESLNHQENNRWEVGFPSPAREAAYVWHYWIPSLIAMNLQRYRMCSIDNAIASNIPFIFPLELRWEFIEWLARDAAPNFLTPHVPAAVLQAARDGRAVIMLFFSHEARLMTFAIKNTGVQGSAYDLILDFVQRHKLPSKAVWFLQGNLSGGKEYEEWLKIHAIKSADSPFETRFVDMYSFMAQSLYHLHQTGKNVQMEWEVHQTANSNTSIATHIALQPLGRSFNETYATLPHSENDITPDKIFLCMNRIIRLHRRWIVCFLQWRGYLDRSLVSFSDEKPDDNYFDDINMQRAWEEIKRKQPLKIDLQNARETYNFGDKPTRIDEFSCANVGEAWPYRQTFISIVNETLFTSDLTFVSEKIWKPIANSHPFIVTGTPGSLNYLRSLGFQTFSPLIDESYDNIDDDIQRMQSIFVTIEKLGRLTDAEKINMRKELAPILHHNLHHLCTMKSPMEKVFDEIAAQLNLDKKVAS